MTSTALVPDAIDGAGEIVGHQQRPVRELCDVDGWPLDDRYDLRKQERDAQMWAQFEPFLDCGRSQSRLSGQALPLVRVPQPIR